MEPFAALVAAFNRGSLDVPEGFLTPRTTFTLNGRTYESILGGSPDDPLIRLLARGAAGYRTAAKALQYAMQNPVITIEQVSGADAEGRFEAALLAEGFLRDTGSPSALRIGLTLTQQGAELLHAEATCAEGDLARLAQARAAGL